MSKKTQKARLSAPLCSGKPGLTNPYGYAIISRRVNRRIHPTANAKSTSKTDPEEALTEKGWNFCNRGILLPHLTILLPFYGREFFVGYYSDPQEGNMAKYDRTSLKAEEFINHKEILETLKYADEHKGDLAYIDQIRG